MKRFLCYGWRLYRGYASETATKMLDPSLESSLKTGDLIEIRLKDYSRWAIYLDNNIVADLEGNQSDNLRQGCNSGSLSSSSGEILSHDSLSIKSFEEFVGKNEWHLNSLDSQMRPLSTRRIMKNVAEVVSDDKGKFSSKSSKELAVCCRYGEDNQTAGASRFVPDLKEYLSGIQDNAGIFFEGLTPDTKEINALSNHTAGLSPLHLKAPL